MDKKAIETISINAVRNSIVTSDFLDQSIADNDKEPSWDGFVYIYSDKIKKKDKLIGRMSVQVKGKISNDFNKTEITYPVKTCDLKNYLYDKGIIFFVVYIRIGDLSNKIYYSELYPIKLRLILKEAKNNKTKNIILKEFPNDGNEKATIFLNCLKNCQKQYSFVDTKLYTLEELKAQGILEGITTTISGYGFDKHDPLKAFFSNEVCMYAQIKGSPVPQPLEFITHNIQTATESKAAITVNGVPFYDSCTRIRSKNSTKVKVGQSFNIVLSEEKSIIKLNYKSSNKLRVLVKDLEFQLAVLNVGYFEFDGHTIPIDYANVDFSNFDIDQQKKLLANLKKIVQVFDLLGATGDIDLSKLTFQEKRHINHLITAFVDKKPVIGLKPDLPPVISTKIADLKFMLAFIRVKGKKDTYNIYDFFKTELHVHYKDKDGNTYDTSQFVILKANDYLDITNIRFDTLLPSYKPLKDDSYKYQQANFVLLDLLIAHDMCGGSKSILLKTASDFAEWLMEADENYLPYYIRCLNRLQVIRRQREFTPDEIGELCKITESSSSCEEALVGAYLLLDNQIAAKLHFENLELEKKELFKKYPIYHFWK
jgi:hypothetical protein